MRNEVNRALVAKTNLFQIKKIVNTLCVLVCMLGVSPSAWANVYTGSQTMHATSAEPAKGLVYANNSSSAKPAITDYTSPSAATKVDSNGEEGMAFASYVWAMPARGYQFTNWTKSTNGNTAPNTETTYNALAPATNTGSGDKVTTTVPRMQTHHGWTMANFGAATGYDVVYKQPEGGKYTVEYKYYTVNESTNKFKTDDGQTLQLTPTSGDKTPTDPRDASNHKTYKADSVTLTATEGNFIAWHKNGVEISRNNPYTLQDADKDNVQISALFKYIVLGNADGELTVNATAKGTYNRTIYVIYTQKIGPWVAADFTISPKNPDGVDASNDYGTIEFGAISIDETNNRLVIPYTYTATNWGGISVDVTIAPPAGAGNATQFSIACSAEEIVDYEACIEESGERTHTGTLAAMMTQANSMDNKPTLKLMQNKPITAPLSFTNSFTFDVNGKVLTANCASAFSMDAAGIDVKIIDGSFTQVGEIHTSASSSNPVSVVTFTQKAKLTMQGGTLSAENTGAGAAYGVDVQQGSILYMTGGNLTVTAGTGNAQGVHVATASDYATLNGGSVTVSAPTNAYGIWSAGSSNVTSTTIDVKTTTGTTGYGFYINGGVTTLTEATTTVSVKTAGAGGGFVKAGRLNVNGGSIAVTAENSVVYGVYIAAGATAMLQQKAVVTAEATGASGTEVFGINNLGTVSLANITVMATSPTTNATAVNTATSATSTTIEGGTYRANTTGGTAYGLHHQYGTLNVDGGIFRAIGSGDNIYGGCAIANATFANATLYGETQGSGNTAYGFVGGVANKNITLTNCTITALSNTSKAYAIFSRANVTATGCTLNATTLGTNYAYGFYAENGTNNIVNTNATVSSYTTHAYGVYHIAGSLSVNGGEYNVQAKQYTASAEQSAYAYGLYNFSGQTTSTQNATFNTSSGNNTFSKDVYGAYINGTLKSTGCTYDAQAKLNAYGILGYTASNLELKKNIITSTAISGATSYGIHAKKQFTIEGDIVSAVGATTGVYAMFFDASTSVGEVLDGKFSAQGNGTNGYGALNDKGTVGKVLLKGGVYKTTINLQKYVHTGYQVFHLDETHPDYADGYRYTIATENPSPYVCRIVNGAYYATLEEALQYTQDHNGSFTIVMTQSYTLPAGDYTLPSNATLIVPCKFGQTSITVDYPNNPAIPDHRTDIGLREDFLRLTIAKDAHINVSGKIGVSGDMYCQESGYISYNNSPYGYIYMEEGSLIQLNSGAVLYAWGFISGAGNITVKNNAEVHEMFQIGDMKTAGNLSDGYYGNSYGHFLVNQYCIHNVEVPTTYYYNSRLICAMYNYYKGTGTYQGGYQIKIVGTSDALFEVTSDDESSWVRKSYDAVHDMQVWDVNSSAQLGSLDMTIASESINSLDYILPITSNMKIHVLDGNFTITQSTEFLPGSSIEIDKTASLTLNQTYKNSKNQTKNLHVYVFDKDQWPLSTATCSPVYSPGWSNGSKPSRTAGDAAINVHGNINVQGALYTTRSIEEGANTTYGANIYSNNADAGTVFFENAAPATTTTIDLITGVSSNAITTKTVTMDPALLKNGNGSFTPTSGTLADHSFAYMSNEWTETYTDGCFEMEGGKAYAKPSDYVALKKQREDAGTYDDLYIKEDHTYVSEDESRIFIHLPGSDGECQWWEVEATTDPSVFECKKTGYEGFYYYEETGEIWKLKTVTVTFYSAEEGEDVLKTIETDFNGIPDQAVIATNPTKATTTGYTYQFYGWKSSVTGTEYPWTATLEVATADMSYRPVFTATKRNYTITFVDAKNGANMPVETPYGDHPSYDPVKDATAQYTFYFLNWTDASGNTYAIDDELPAVTGAATYTAHWSQIVNKYTITWKDGEEVLETDPQRPYGTATAFNGILPTKATDDDFVYAFSGWLSSLTGQTYANGSTPTVAGETTYEAQFSTTPRYAITFNNYNGTQLQKEPVTQGETPVYNGVTPARERDYDGYYVFTGWKNTDGDFYAPNATLPAVTGKETYTAQYSYTTDLFSITLNNVDGNGASWSGKFGLGSTPFYNPDNNDIPVIPAKAGNAQYSYPFAGWDPELQPVTGEASYTAQFGQELNSYTITFTNLDGNGATQTIDVEYGQTPVSPVTPTKGDNYYTYDFTGWSPAVTAVSGNATYTAQFSSTGTPRTFAITFDGDNGQEPQVLYVAYGQTPAPTAPTKAPDEAFSYAFNRWEPAITAVTGDATYTAQYTQTLRTYTVRFINYDGTELQSSTMAYGATPTPPSNPTKPMDEANKKAYVFNGWSPAVASVTGDVTYTAQFNEVNLVATVTTSAGETTPYNSWTTAYNNRANNCTIKLYKDVTGLTTMQALDKTGLTLDLNGYTISGTFASNRGIVSSTAANVTITDSSVGKTGTISSSASVNGTPYVLYVNGGSLTIDYANVSAANTRSSRTANAYGVYVYNGSVVINNGKFKATSGYSSGTKSAVYIRNNYGTATIKGGYYSNSVTPATGYQCVTTSELSGYTHKVIPVVYTITLNKGTHGAANQSATVDFAATELKSFTEVTSAGYDCTGYFDEELQVLNADGTFAAENVSGYITGGKWSKAANSTLTAKWNLSSTLESNNNENIPIVENGVVDATIIHAGGKVDIETGVTLTTTDLILEGTSNSSGQLIADGKDNINVTGNAFFDWTPNGETGTAYRTWYAIAVPWEVDAETGIILKETGRTLRIGVDFDMIYYNGQKRGEEGNVPGCWEYVQWDVQGHDRQGNSRPVDKTVHPGRLYMMYFDPGLKTIRFVKKTGADVLYMDPINVSLFPESTGNDDKDANWNGIANPRTYFASLSAGSATYAQVLNNGNLDDYFADPGVVYQTINLASSKLTVGKPLFVQATQATPVVVTKQTTAGIVNAAPRRRAAAAAELPKGIDAVYRLAIAGEDQPEADNLFVQVAEDEKADRYTIGLDLVKGGVASGRAQVWVNRYDAKLSVNTQALSENEATYPLTIQIPANGEYVVSAGASGNEDYALYLTRDGEAIWNLSDGAYTGAFEKGTTSEYGLRVSAKSPQVATGLDEAVVDAKGETRKVLINNTVYIIRGENVYSVDGQLVK